MVRRVAGADRRAGAAVRRAAPADTALGRGARVAAAALSPGFRALVAVLVMVPPTRRTGVRALACATGAALVARAARDRLGRRRPGPRTEGGFPSRHAAAATAIVVAVHRSHPVAGVVLGGVAVGGLAARVATGDHDPADIVAGVVLGGAIGAAAGVIERSARPR